MRDKDISIINENIDIIMDKARNKEIQIIEPVIDEFKKVRSIILDFIKKEKRIIYGGYALNNLIKKINPTDVFYKDTDYTDIEFYSNKPIEDMKKICDTLYIKGFKFIQGKSAQHFDTYTIFVNFTAYCDITYMPSNLFYSIMTENLDGLKIIHPKFILVDLLRQFNDPMTSFWRLDKNIKRGKLLIKNYPLELMSTSKISTSSSNINLKKLENDSVNILNSLIPNIVKLKSIIFIGPIAYNTYMNPNINILKQTSIYDFNPIELISTNLAKDVEIIYNLIVKYFIDSHKIEQFNDKIIMEQYYPFFQFTDKSIVFKNNGVIFLTIYGNNEKCIPYNDIIFIHNSNSYPIKIGTFNIDFMFNLIKFHKAFADKDKNNQILYDEIMANMLISRDKFLDSNNKTILDNTIFEDLKINCLGDPISPMRKFMYSRRDRKLLPRSAIHPYDPEERKDNYPTDIYYFNNYSGNIINNSKDLVYDIKK